MIAFALVIGIVTFTFNSIALAGTIAINAATSTQLWGIGEYEEGGSAIIACTASCNVRVSEEYTKPASSLYNLTSHTVFAWASNWTGNAYGYDLVVSASPTMNFACGSTSLGSQSLSYYSNVITDPDWIWDCQRSTASKGFTYSYVTASSYGTFWAPDAVIWLPIYWQPSSRTVSSSVSF